MPTVVHDPQPAEIAELIEKRSRLGQDRYDEVWGGVLHMNPVPGYEHQRLVVRLLAVLQQPAEAAGLELTPGVNIGAGPDDFRVPDVTAHRPGAHGVWQHTAALAVEILSVGDVAWQKLDFYAEHGIDELLYVDPATKSVVWQRLDEGRYREAAASQLLGIGASVITKALGWD